MAPPLRCELRLYHRGLGSLPNKASLSFDSITSSRSSSYICISEDDIIVDRHSLAVTERQVNLTKNSLKTPINSRK